MGEPNHQQQRFFNMFPIPTLQPSRQAFSRFAGIPLLLKLMRSLKLEQAFQTFYIKQRKKGYQEADFFFALLFLFATGHRTLKDLDRIQKDPIFSAFSLPNSRTLGEWLLKWTPEQLNQLDALLFDLTKTCLPDFLRSFQQQGYSFLPIFLDASLLEVQGRYFQGAKRAYNQKKALLLHASFIDNLAVQTTLHPGNVHATQGWEEQFERVAALLPTPLLDKKLSVWVRLDNAYYNKKVLQAVHEQGWELSISVTHSTYKSPLLTQLKHRPQSAWRKAIRSDGTVQVTELMHQPIDWPQAMRYLVIKTQLPETKQRLLIDSERFSYTFICTNNTSLDAEEVIRRHRGKQGQENAFKGPLEDLGLHHPRCHSLIANQVIARLVQLTQLLLRILQQQRASSTPKQARKQQRARLRTICRQVICVPGKWVRTARQPRVLWNQSDWARLFCLDG